MDGAKTFHMTLTEEDVVAAALAFQWRTLRSRRFAIFVVGIAIGITAFAWLLSGEGEFWEAFGIMGGLSTVASVIMILFVRYVTVPIFARRQFWQSVALREPVEITFDDTHILLRNERSRSRFKWDEFHLWDETEHHFILYQSAMLYNIVPKKILPDKQQLIFRSYLENTDVKRA